MMHTSLKYEYIICIENGIAIRPIPVLEGSAAERFEEMLESNRDSAYTIVPDSIHMAVRAMQERSSHVVIKMPK